MAVYEPGANPHAAGTIEAARWHGQQMNGARYESYAQRAQAFEDYQRIRRGSAPRGAGTAGGTRQPLNVRMPVDLPRNRGPFSPVRTNGPWDQVKAGRNPLQTTTQTIGQAVNEAPRRLQQLKPATRGGALRGAARYGGRGVLVADLAIESKAAFEGTRNLYKEASELATGDPAYGAAAHTVGAAAAAIYGGAAFGGPVVATLTKEGLQALDEGFPTLFDTEASGGAGENLGNVDPATPALGTYTFWVTADSWTDQNRYEYNIPENAELKTETIPGADRSSGVDGIRWYLEWGDGNKEKVVTHDTWRNPTVTLTSFELTTPGTDSKQTSAPPERPLKSPTYTPSRAASLTPLVDPVARALINAQDSIDLPTPTDTTAPPAPDLATAPAAENLPTTTPAHEQPGYTSTPGAAPTGKTSNPPQADPQNTPGNQGQTAPNTGGQTAPNTGGQTAPNTSTTPGQALNPDDLPADLQNAPGPWQVTTADGQTITKDADGQVTVSETLDPKAQLNWPALIVTGAIGAAATVVVDQLTGTETGTQAKGKQAIKTPAPPVATAPKCPCNLPLVEQMNKQHNDLLGKLGLAGTTAVGEAASTGTIMGKLNAIETFMKKAWEATRIQKVIDAMTLVTVLHNASMISRDVGETLGYAFAQGLDVLGINDEEGNPLDVNGWFGTQANNFAESIFGAERWHGINEFWNKANTVIRSASMIVWTIRSINDGISEVIEWSAENIGFIGNALRKWGVVGENAYRPMATRVRAQDGYRRKVGRILDGLETVDDTVSSYAMVIGEAANLTDEIGELGQQRQQFNDSVRDLRAGAYPDNSDLVATEAEANANATSGPAVTAQDMEPATNDTP